MIRHFISDIGYTKADDDRCSIFQKVIFQYEECNGHQSNVQSSKALGSVKWEINTAATLIQNRLFIAPLLAMYECAVLILLHQYACKAIT